MKKIISLLLCIVLISGCGKVVNKTEPDKTDNQNANQPAQSPSPSPSASPLPTLSPTATPKATATPALTLPSGQYSSFDSYGISNTQIGIYIGSVILVSLIVLGVLWQCGCCCFNKSVKPSAPKKTG